MLDINLTFCLKFINNLLALHNYKQFFIENYNEGIHIQLVVKLYVYSFRIKRNKIYVNHKPFKIK